jgi:hypothetical protein
MEASKTDAYISSHVGEFINDYVEGNLSIIGRIIFTEYLSANEQVRSFVNKSERGKRALKHAYRVKAADDFEEKLAQRIAHEKEVNE